MCGVIGFQTKSLTEKQFSTLKRVFRESKVRGLHSCGFTVLSPDLKTFKTDNVSKLNDTLHEYIKIGSPAALIGHTRYSTSGDFKEMKNNQPLKIGDVSLVFNGVISQADPSKWETFDSPYETANDGEILIKKIKAGQNWEKWITQSDFSFAGLILMGGQMIVMRNQNRPLWWGELDGASFFASTKDIFLRSGISKCAQIFAGVRYFFNVQPD